MESIIVLSYSPLDRYTFTAIIPIVKFAEHLKYTNFSNDMNMIHEVILLIKEYLRIE